MKKIKSIFVVVILFITYISFSQNQQIRPYQSCRLVTQNSNFDAILLVDGKIYSSKMWSILPPEVIEDISFLRNPLYLINGREYSEEELFGANPTSIYAPLSEQEIEYILAIKQEDAVPVYGEKGRKGVVIVSAKNGKPAKK
jgi:hypothetical protein